MAQSRKSVLCLGISCGIMASQATRITAYNIWGAKAKPWYRGKKCENYFVQFACDRWEIFLVPERKYFCHPKIFYVWPQIFFLKVEILRKILKKKNRKNFTCNRGLIFPKSLLFMLVQNYTHTHKLHGFMIISSRNFTMYTIICILYLQRDTHTHTYTDKHTHSIHIKINFYPWVIHINRQGFATLRSTFHHVSMKRFESNRWSPIHSV